MLRGAMRGAGRLSAKDGAVKFFSEVVNEYCVLLCKDFLTERESFSVGARSRDEAGDRRDWEGGG